MGLGVDRSAAACRVARDNLGTCGFSRRSLVVEGDWADALALGSADVVVSNPPYIETAAIAALDADVREHDPRLALDGGADGLAAYRLLARTLPPLLRPGGVAALEVGRGQDGAVRDLFGSGLADLRVRADLAGIGRVVVGRRPGA